MFHAGQSVRTCARCRQQPRRSGGTLCSGCNAADMRTKRRQARMAAIQSGAAKRRGRKDGEL